MHFPRNVRNAKRSVVKEEKRLAEKKKNCLLNSRHRQIASEAICHSFLFSPDIFSFLEEKRKGLKKASDGSSNLPGATIFKGYYIETKNDTPPLYSMKKSGKCP